jgi:outer membrane protein OmpA-like peptidoglycan-associated protein
MIMKLYKLTLIAFFGFFISIGYAQKGKLRQATKEYKNFSYVKTSEILLDVANEGYKSVDLFQKLGNSFYFNNQMEAAAKWYGELMGLNEEVDPEYYFRYALALKDTENYTKSDKWMQKFYESKTDDSRGRFFASTVDYLTKIENSSRDLVVKNLDINSPFSDFGTTQYKDKLIFASTRGDGRTYKWNEQPFLDLYSAKKQADASYTNIKTFDTNLNTRFHESTVSFTPDDQYIFFTRNNYDKKLRKDTEGTSRLKLYRARTQGYEEWDDVESIHFNSDEYSVAHPSINVQGTKMYFASDMPGTHGLSDLYVVDVNSDGRLGTPVNLGDKINTEGQETFPFINEEGDLYFSSNGYPGLGGLDVFVIRNFENKVNTSAPLVVENIAKPINSPQDDFGYYENLGTKEGFFTSNRDGGKGDDDIYSFSISVPEPCDQLVTGVVRDKKTHELLPNTTVILFDKQGKELDKLVVGDAATFEFELECEEEYLVRGEKEKYASDEKRITTPSVKQELTLELNLDPDEQELEPCGDLAKILYIPIIHFDFDKDNIRPDAALELQKVIAVMQQYPSLKIDVRSHTDCRGSYAYNDDLSARRNKSTINHIVRVGNIDSSRLTGRGYGEHQLVNDCACEPTNRSSCSEAEHQLNRRSEFIIKSINGKECDD